MNDVSIKEIKREIIERKAEIARLEAKVNKCIFLILSTMAACMIGTITFIVLQLPYAALSFIPLMALSFIPAHKIGTINVDLQKERKRVSYLEGTLPDLKEAR